MGDPRDDGVAIEIPNKRAARTTAGGQQAAGGIEGERFGHVLVLEGQPLVRPRQNHERLAQCTLRTLGGRNAASLDRQQCAQHEIVEANGVLQQVGPPDLLLLLRRERQDFRAHPVRFPRHFIGLGRQLALCLDLTPQQHSPGEQQAHGSCDRDPAQHFPAQESAPASFAFGEFRAVYRTALGMDALDVLDEREQGRVTRLAAPLRQVSRLRLAKGHRRLADIERHRSECLPLPALRGLGHDPVRIDGMPRPQHHDAAAGRHGFLDTLGKLLAGAQARVPPHRPAARGQQRIGELARERAVFACVADEDVVHDPLGVRIEF